MGNNYVLMLENDTDDRYITQSTLAELNLSVPVRYEYYSDGLVDVIDEKDIPGVILLAYNTSPEVGFGIIQQFRKHPAYRHIPVIVLTEELQPDLIRKYYLAGANTVIKKPSSVEQTNKKIKVFFDYWFGVAEL